MAKPIYNNYDIIVYGNGIQAVSAACKAAAKINTNKRVLLLIPDTSGLVGGIVTSGGQNFWDTRTYQGSLVTTGSISYFMDGYSKAPNSSTFTGRGYNTTTLHSKMMTSINNYSNLEVVHACDIVDFTNTTSPYRITSVTIREISRATSGHIVWKDSTTKVISGTTFIDASEEGRLARSVNSSVSTGRFDWPSSYLDSVDKLGTQWNSRSSAATAMIKMIGISPPLPPTGTVDGSAYVVDSNDWVCYRQYDANGVLRNFKVGSGSVKPCSSGGSGGQTTSLNSKMWFFNEKYRNDGIAIKPYNLARNGYSSNQWWMNCLMVFNVDGRANERDKTLSGRISYPNVLSGSINTDEAWVKVRHFLRPNSQSRADFLEVIRSWGSAFSNADIANEVIGGTSGASIGQVLYLRDNVHISSNSSNRVHGSEGNYRITREAIRKLETSSGSIDNYNTRVALAFYEIDVHPYKLDDMISSDRTRGLWGETSWKKIRPDYKRLQRPICIPYSAMTSQIYVGNLLICGYALSACSYAWGAIRVAPNLCTIGDAAGISAAYCLNKNILPCNPSLAQISEIQTMLRSVNITLDY